MERIPKSGEFYRHFKNKLYQIVTVAEHSESREKLVIYQALYGDYKTYARPLEMFTSEVDHVKYPDVKQKYRFEKVEPGEVAKAVEPIAEASVINTESVSAAQVTTQAKKPENEPVSTEADELPEPGLLEFLDTDHWAMKYNILVSLRDKMTDKLVDDFAVSLDIVIPEGPLEKRYEELKNCLRTRQKFESQRLR